MQRAGRLAGADLLAAGGGGRHRRGQRLGLAADGGRDLGGHGHAARADGPAPVDVEGGGHHPVAGLGELDLGPVEALERAPGRGVLGLLVGLELEPAGRERPGRPAGVVLGHPDLGGAAGDEPVVGGGQAEGVQGRPDLELALGPEQRQLGRVGPQGLQRAGRGGPARLVVLAAGGQQGAQPEGAPAGAGETQEVASRRHVLDALDGGARRGPAGRLATRPEQPVQLLLEPLQAGLVRDPLGRRGELLVALAAGAGAEHVTGRQADGDAELALHWWIPALRVVGGFPLAYPAARR